VPSRPVFVVTGPSGAGKGTLIKGLTERVDGLEVAVSATTRPQRPGEVDGRDYWFLSDDEFTRRVDAGEFLEWVPYVSGKRYGTLSSEIDRIGREGAICILELELEGALKVQRDVPGSITIFIAADVDELERRLRERATESTGEIGERARVPIHGAKRRRRAGDDRPGSPRRVRARLGSRLSVGRGTAPAKRAPLVVFALPRIRFCGCSVCATGTVARP
jgi:guanylate kinase